MKSAGLKDEDIHRTEEAMLEMNQLSVEEIAQRRGELRKTRELMFRADVKAKRVGKIRTQERLDCEVAYEETKKEVEKWSETMNHIRMVSRLYFLIVYGPYKKFPPQFQAEHLSFPLQSQSTGRVSNLELTAKFKASLFLLFSI